MTGSLLRTRPATTAAMLAIFDDSSTLRHALSFEAALARAQAETGLVSPEVAQRIASACADIEIDPAALAEEAAHAGTLAIPLVARLREVLTYEPEAAAAVHRGATSQDLADTVTVLQAREAMDLLTIDLASLSRNLAELAELHSETPAIGRTLLQNALPISFGLRVAQWLAGLVGARRRLEILAAEALVLQWGGAAGTRAGLEGHGSEAAARLAKALGLRPALAPWHARRDGLAALGASLGIVIGVLGKIGRDISLMAQNTIGEAREPLVPGRGGSSAMPHKRNPTASQLALSAAVRAPGLVATLLAALPQEQERGIGGWQTEAPVLADLFMLAGGSAAALAAAVEGLEIDLGALRRNLDAADVGSDPGEAAQIVATILDDYRRND